MKALYRVGLIIACGILEVFISAGIGVLPVHAETRVGGLVSHDAVWTMTGSPYVLTESITVPDDATLTIEPGVVMQIAPESDTGDIGYAPGIFVAGGHISIQGSRDSHVTVNGLSGVFVTNSMNANGSADIAETDFHGGSRISFENSRGTIATSTIINADIGLYFKDSIVSVWGSKIQNNDIGIYVQPHKVFLSGNLNWYQSQDSFGMGGIGNALDNSPDLYASSSLVISGSSITGNTTRAIFDNADLSVQAAGNWWGSSGGPSVGGMNSVFGKVLYSPWLFSEPAFDMAGPKLCCSSILFIPGIEGTRLYRSEKSAVGGLFGRGTTTKQLWEPISNADVAKLKMSSSGSSTDQSIYSGRPIDKALGVVDVYGGFMKFLDGLVVKGTVGEWMPFGYDWRKPINEVVLGAEKKASTTQSLMQTVIDLASRSKTGKINIVAHSNGGLVAKYLVKTLADMGKANLIDSVISVAVPYLGTPEAISALLHGDNQIILGGFIMNQSSARTLSANMPSAYSLLPSHEFFSHIFSPTVVFASTTISSSESQTSFISDKANRALVLAANTLHGLVDPFEWPIAIARWAIVGWNDRTTTAVKYTASGKHTLLTTKAGDGTVMAPSAYYNAGEPVSISGVSHADILESSSTQAAIETMIQNPSTVLDKVSTLPGVTVGEIDWKKMMTDEDASRKELRISTHSPVKLHVYDTHGNHTGEIPLPAAVASQVEDGLYTMKEEKIPGSSYDVLECSTDTDCDTEITVPDTGEKYTAVVDGVGTGSFTLDVERVRATTTVETIEWKNVPVTPLAMATTTIQSSSMPSYSTTSLASSTSVLSIDMNGDGALDATSSTNTSFDSRRSLDIFKKFKWPKYPHFWFKKVTEADHLRIMDEIAALIRRFER